MTYATHDGVFHADDVFAAATLRLAYPGCTIVRSRDPKVLASADLCFDVGEGDYDHHQRDGNGARENGIPYASFGLIWRRFGSLVCGSSADVAAAVDHLLVQQVDAADNGYPLTEPLHPDALPVTISSMISWLNPSWEEEQMADERFADAVELALVILQRAIVRARGKIAAEWIIASAVASAADPRIIVLDRFVPWQEVLISLSADALYIVYPSAGTWRCQVVPAAIGMPAARKPLPAAWGGLSGAELAALTGVADATFAHRGLFIAGAQSREGALALAHIAVEN